VTSSVTFYISCYFAWSNMYMLSILLVYISRWQFFSSNGTSTLCPHIMGSMGATVIPLTTVHQIHKIICSVPNHKSVHNLHGCVKPQLPLDFHYTTKQHQNITNDNSQYVPNMLHYRGNLMYSNLLLTKTCCQLTTVISSISEYRSRLLYQKNHLNLKY